MAREKAVDNFLSDFGGSSSVNSSTSRLSVSGIFADLLGMIYTRALFFADLNCLSIGNPSCSRES